MNQCTLQKLIVVIVKAGSGWCQSICTPGWRGMKRRRRRREMTDISDNMTKQDPEAQIRLCAREKVLQMRLVSDMTEKRIFLRIEIDRIESNLNILEKECERLEKEGMELTRRLMDMEKGEQGEKGD
jgi:hypothetical protein